MKLQYRPLRLHLLSVVAVAALLAPVAATANTIIIANPLDRMVRDTNGSGTGDAFGNVAGTLAHVGEVGSIDGEQGRYYLPFGLLSSEQTAAILNAPNTPNAITLNISLGEKSGVSNVAVGEETLNLTVDIYGFTNRTTLEASHTDYENTSVVLLHGQAVTTSTPNGFLSFDITDFAKQEMAADHTILAFRFQISQQNALPNSDGQWNRYIFHTADHANKPYIEVIPEPSTYGFLLATALFGLIAFRKRLGSR